MSWSQDYSVPSIDDLLEKLTGKRTYQLLKQELNRQGLKIVHVEDVLLDDGFMQEVRGYKVELSDGRVFVPKLVERFTENGNHGIDSYDYVLEGETPAVQHTSADTTDPDIDVYEIPEGFGEMPEKENELESHACDVVDMSDGPCGDPSHDR